VLDFTLAKYRELCQSLLVNGFSPIKVIDYLQLQKTRRRAEDKVVILRHDVDRKENFAQRMAKLEASMGINSTYYFRYPYTFEPDIIHNFLDLGHEIGYNYEVLSKAQGKPEAAIHLFQAELDAMREITDIHTICMHGSPLSRFDNRDLWKYYDFREFGIEGEAYLSVEGTRYFTDTGRSWSSTNSMRDRMPELNQQYKVVTTDDLLGFVASGIPCTLYLNTHPERWSDTRAEYYIGAIRDFSFNMGKKVLVHMRP
jgi:hypothetical protein